MRYLIQTPLSALSLALLAATLGTSLAHANDSAGYVGTGGVTYIKNDNIAMMSEDLYISKKKIEVNYQFKNLSKKDITETILFPLPPVPSFSDANFASTDELYNSFKIWANGKAITPTAHVRAFVSPKDSSTEGERVDVTSIFKECGLSDDELKSPWSAKGDWQAINRKLADCNSKKLTDIVGEISADNIEDYPSIFWESQIIYSWQQTFKANAITRVRHSYAPLVGGGVHLDSEYGYENFCVDANTQKSFGKGTYQPYQALSYILTTGANWARPIGDFTLTIERDKDEVVSLCWKNQGTLKKIASNKFQVKTKNFIPEHDLDIAFIQSVRMSE